MTISSAATSFPAHAYDQRLLLRAFVNYWGPKLDNPVFLERLHARVGVSQRHLVLPLHEYETLTFGQANDHWIRAACDLGRQALCTALTRATLTPRDLTAIFFVSVTGIASPSIDARLVNLMGLSPHIKRIPIFGLGCVAGAAAIARASDYVRAFPAESAAVLSVELCSLTLQRDDLSVANLISAGLFGDGAAAVIVSGAERPAQGPSIVATRSIFYPGTERLMGWDISEKGFRIVLSPEVPSIVHKHLASDIDDFLAAQNLSRHDISSWILHTGGPKILEATEQALGLPETALEPSWNCLRRMGNLSSASVLAVLEEHLAQRRQPPGSHSLLAAMGPGFCSELVLLRW